MPKPARAFLARLGRFMGVGTGEDARFPDMESSLYVLKNRGFAPAFCVDVGAYSGEWTRLCRAVFPGAKVLMVEPQDSKRPILEDLVTRSGGGVRFEAALLGAAEGGEVEFVEMETGSSVYEEASPYPRSKTRKQIRTLDRLVAEAGFGQIGLLKIDVQGYELEVLKGALDVLKGTEVVLMEASLVPVNAGCPLISDVVRFMDEAGFKMFDFCSQIRRKDGVLWQTDLLFIRHDSPLLPDPRLTSSNW